MFSPAPGKQLIVRGICSVVLFTAASMVPPTASTMGFSGAIRLLIGLALLIAALLWLLNPEQAAAIGSLLAVGLGGFVLGIGLSYLLSSVTGRILGMLV